MNVGLGVGPPSWDVQSDHLWKRICTTHFPSLSNLQLITTTNPAVSYRQLYAIAYASSKRRLKTPSKPHLSLQDLIFAVNISTTKSNRRRWRYLATHSKPIETVSFSPAAEGWFSEELPSPGCCSSAVASGIVADLKVGFCRRRESSDGKVTIERVSLGILRVVDWR
ncbi:hypothetical protein FNV43_RR16397 [Rhamnella rubrinervis]|uniref:Uncharacterized protein n=1 Tax=Rhamnella rubrinervis TaxID=2594499 RepID=A0A8K0GYR1_9ROSA|nr:hypothetical protein FNV43_RR16397 [Rhamnella rubrinervis]